MKKTTDELLKEMQTSDNAERFIKDNPEDIIFNGMEELFSSIEMPLCAVLAKMKDGGIAASRHDSYVRIYEEQRKVTEWKRRQNAD